MSRYCLTFLPATVGDGILCDYLEWEITPDAGLSREWVAANPRYWRLDVESSRGWRLFTRETRDGRWQQRPIPEDEWDFLPPGCGWTQETFLMAAFFWSRGRRVGAADAREGRS